MPYFFRFLAAMYYVAIMHKVSVSEVGEQICGLLVGLKADISCDSYIYYALMKIVVIQSTIQCCKSESQLELTSHLITAHRTVIYLLSWCIHRIVCTERPRTGRVFL